MPKKKKGGHNNTRVKLHNCEIKYAESGQYYAIIKDKRGSPNGRLTFGVETMIGEARVASAGKTLSKQSRFQIGDYVVIAPLSSINENGHYEILFHYNKFQATILETELKKTGNHYQVETTIEKQQAATSTVFSNVFDDDTEMRIIKDTFDENEIDAI
jgi:hypothetical protein